MLKINSKIIIGVWPLSGDFGPIPPSDYEKCIKKAIDLKIDTFDTAPNYGNGYSESALGLILDGQKNIKINTKFGSNPFGAKSFNIDDLKKSFYNSLKRLRVEKINYLFLHNPRTEVKDFTHIINLMQDFKSQNLLSDYGISIAKGFQYNGIEGFNGIQLDCNMLYLSDLNKYSRKKQKIFARSPLASGILSGKLNSDTKFHKTDYRSNWLKGSRLTSILSRLDVINKSLNGISLPSLARKFLFQNKNIDHVIFGVKKPSHIEDIIFDFKSPILEKDIIDKIKDLEKNNFYQTDNNGF